MTFEAFTEKVENAVRSRLGEECGIAVEKIMKNNGVELTGLIFLKEGSDIASTIYLDGFHEAYERGRTMGETVQRILEIYQSGKRQKGPDLSFFADYQQVRERLSCRLISYEKNGVLLRKVPHRRILDLALVYHCILPEEGSGCACILINREHLEAWGMGEEGLAADAEANMPKILPPSLSSMGDFFRDVRKETLDGRAEEAILQECRSDGRMTDGLADLLEDHGRRIGRRMLILSNAWHFYGACAMLYPGLLERVAEENGCGLFILPCSVHEVILLTDSGKEDPEGLCGMVREVNRENVPAEEFLSDHVYYYDRKRGLRIVE